MQQIELFTPAAHLARHGGPETSREAAVELEASGSLGRMEQLALNLISMYPGRTAYELEKNHGYERGQISKRVSTLVQRGLVFHGIKRKCTKSNRSAFPLFNRVNKPR